MPENLPNTDNLSAPDPVIIPTGLDIEKEVSKRLDEERPKLITSIRQEFQVQYDASVAKKQNEMLENNRVVMEKVINDFKKEQTPPTSKEIQELLDGEYISFTVKIKWAATETSTVVTEEITIGELPASQERKILRLVKDKIGPVIKQFTPGVISVLQGDTEDKLTAVIEMIDPAGDVLSELVSLILSSHSGYAITKETVENSLSYGRQISILSAQLEANRLRDFFSRVVRMSR